MKKIISSTLIALVLLVATSYTTNAQKKFRGTINYTMSYAGTIDAATAAQMPKTVVVSVYDNLQKMTLSMGAFNLDIITNGDSKTVTTLMDIMGQKKYYKMTTEEIEAKIAENPVPEIKYSEETKTIAGYVCKKAEYIQKDDEGNSSSATVYYTEELGGAALNYGGEFNNLKGVPLEYISTDPDGIISTVTATEVKKGKVKDTDFLIPTDYTELTPEEKKEILQRSEGTE